MNSFQNKQNDTLLAFSPLCGNQLRLHCAIRTHLSSPNYGVAKLLKFAMFLLAKRSTGEVAG